MGGDLLIAGLIGAFIGGGVTAAAYVLVREAREAEDFGKRFGSLERSAGDAHYVGDERFDPAIYDQEMEQARRGLPTLRVRKQEP